MKKKSLTEEEKVAIRLADIVSDLRLDLDLVGMYFSQIARTVIFNRFEIVYESAKESGHGRSRDEHYEYIANLPPR